MHRGRAVFGNALKLLGGAILEADVSTLNSLQRVCGHAPTPPNISKLH